MELDVQDNWGDVPFFKKRRVEWIEVNPNATNIIYMADVDSDKWMIRMNDFPEEPLYTLIVGGDEIIHFNEWPAEWSK